MPPPDPETSRRELQQLYTLAGTGHTEQAIQAGLELLQQHPELPELHFLLGSLYQTSRQHELAIRHYCKVLELAGEHADTLNNLGILHETSGRTEDALDCYRRAVRQTPASPSARYNLGRLLRLRGEPGTALEQLQAAHELSPENAQILLETALALKAGGDYDKAMDAIEEALAIAPGNAGLLNVRGNLHQAQGEIQSAIDDYSSAFERQPDFAEACNNLGSALLARGDVEGALKNYKTALSLKPDWHGAASNRLLAENYISDDPQALYELHLQWGKTLHTGSKTTIKDKPGDSRKIRIGFISPDFRQHSVACFIQPFFRSFDRDAFEIIALSDVASPDSMTEQLRSLVSEWVSVYGLDDAELYDVTQRLDIDILVDLAGHTANNRLPIFAMQAAPVQVSYLGYPNTTGLQTIKYRITDALADPPGSGQVHTEQLLRLPGCFLCFVPLDTAPEPGRLPALSNGYVSFGSFNVLAKLSEQCVKTWCDLLSRIENARLILKSAGLQDSGTRNYLLDRFRQNGIDTERIELVTRTTDYNAHMQVYNRVDISLDTFPYNGTTTSCESLWMGVPVISLSGNRHAGCVGHTLLHHAGLEGCIARTPEEYIARAVELASDILALSKLRASLRDNISNSPLCDGTGFSRRLETLFKNIHASGDKSRCDNSGRQP